MECNDASAVVTIVIPVFNVEKFISQTLHSVMQQSYRPIEIFVSDNHSTDATRQILGTYAQLGVTIVDCPVRTEESQCLEDNAESASKNWNSLIKYGSGEFLALYHGDDVYEKHIVETQVAFLKRNPQCSVVFTMGSTIDEDGRTLRVFNRQLKQFIGNERVFDYPELVEAMLEWGCFLHAPTAMIRREAWRQVGGLIARYEQACDVNWWLRFARVGPIGVINKPLYRRRISRAQDSARAKDLYRYRPLPVFKVIDECLACDDLGQRVSVHALSIYEMHRAGDLAGAGVMLIADGRLDLGMENVAKCKRVGLFTCFVASFTHPRLVLQVVLGKGLLLAWRLGCGSWVGRQLANHSWIFRR